MAEHDTTALERALYRRLAGAGVWGDRVFPDYVPAGTTRPYVVFLWSGGGEANVMIGGDAEHVYVVKCVSAVKAEARAGAAQIAALLNDVELGDGLDAGQDWRIGAVTREMAIELVEMVNGQPVYQAGNRYRVTMQARG